ncbi:McbB family protein [Lysinibacillus fusiformis]|uniref:McbB family protein n=1 Tax=Lysinibacillus fusiformis TaxID=28031 RepID=UPI00263B09E3|nr:McbB family protein [Lysinibacillus fusiformis]MDC6268623.1 McbB family protein [Lysinibacillus sphaericus]MDN4969416.1 McbB family protein [Lysinibacillus fusiformis]
MRKSNLLEKEELFIINKFIMYPLKETLIIQTPTGIIKVSDTRMIEIIKNWDINSVRKYTKSEFKYLFEDETEDAISFLENYQIIEKEKENEVNIKGITIIAEENENYIVELLLERLTNQYQNRLSIKTVSQNNFTSELFEDQFIIYIQTNYNKKRVKEFKEIQRKLNNSVTLMGYTYSSNFYLDCLYDPKWKLPCHNCHLGHIQSNFYSGEENEMSYQMMVELLYQESEDAFIRGIPLTSLQEMNIACLVLNKVIGYLGDLNRLSIHPQDLNKSTMLNLKTLKKYEDTAIFWEMCDCYEE